MFDCDFEDSVLILISLNKRETWTFISNFCKFEGWKGRHVYGRPRAALSLTAPLFETIERKKITQWGLPQEKHYVW